jgi:hypothetical protein
MWNIFQDLMFDHRIIRRLIVLLFCSLSLALVACTSSITPSRINPTIYSTPGESLERQTSTNTVQSSSTLSYTPSQTITSTKIVAPSKTPKFTNTPTITPSNTATISLSPTITPTYAILRGTVLEQSNCRYGPGAAYLYKYGLYAGNNVEIIGRNEVGTWIVVRGIGGTNPCWVKASLLNIRGDVMSVAPGSLPLPQSPYYGPLSGVSAMRSENNVTISWNPLVLRAGDDSLQFPYLVEAWLCKDGQLSFNPIGTWDTIVVVQDEPGCSEPSHARVYGVEKHGYTVWVAVPWPQP